MTVTAEKAIYFECEKCGQGQYRDYTLEKNFLVDRVLMDDHIDCEACNHTNHVIEEI